MWRGGVAWVCGCCRLGQRGQRGQRGPARAPPSFWIMLHSSRRRVQCSGPMPSTHTGTGPLALRSRGTRVWVLGLWSVGSTGKYSPTRQSPPNQPSYSLIPLPLIPLRLIALPFKPSSPSTPHPALSSPLPFPVATLSFLNKLCMCPSPWLQLRFLIRHACTPPHPPPPHPPTPPGGRRAGHGRDGGGDERAGGGGAGRDWDRPGHQHAGEPEEEEAEWGWGGG